VSDSECTKGPPKLIADLSLFLFYFSSFAGSPVSCSLSSSSGPVFPSAPRPFPFRSARFSSDTSLDQSVIFRGSQALSSSTDAPGPSPTDSEYSTAPLNSEGEDQGPDTTEKRKRLAAYLDQTAAAMEGGKSLAMAKEQLCELVASELEVEHESNVSSSQSLELPLAVDDEEAKEMERLAKMTEKRRRTIRELVETEASYASDMAVARDIFLERARGAGECGLLCLSLSFALLRRSFKTLADPRPSQTSHTLRIV
jgi:hypothetical protein